MEKSLYIVPFPDPRAKKLYITHFYSTTGQFIGGNGMFVCSIKNCTLLIHFFSLS